MTNTEIFTRVSTACEELEELLSGMDASQGEKPPPL